jgi:hypothetical protein
MEQTASNKNTDMESTFAKSGPTTDSQPTPNTFFTMHANTDPMILAWHYYNAHKQADVWL